MRSLAPLAIAALLVPGLASAGNDWPQSRYDETHQGAVPAGLNTEFVPFTTRWWNNLSLPGPVSSPAIREDVVYFGDAGGKIWAYDRESGGILWSNSTQTRVSGTPAVGQDFVYVVSESGQLYSFNRKTGTLQNGYPISVGATFGSPLLHEDIIYVGSSDGSVKAFFVSTRQQRWTFSTTVTFGSGVPANQTQCSGGSVDGTPVLFEQWIFFGSTNKCFFAIPRTSFGTVGKDDVAWVFKATDSIRTSPTIDRANRRVIFGDVSGNIYALPVSASQQRVLAPTWTFNEPIIEGRPSEFKASPAIAGANVIVGARNGNLRALSLSSGTSAWVRNLNGEIVGGPAIANGRILVGSFDRNMYMLNATSGALLQTTLGLAEIDTSPAISGTQGFWADKLGNLYSWGGQKPERPDIQVVSVSSSLVATVPGTISFRVKNVGILPAPNSTAVLRVANAKVAEPNIPSLEPGQEYSGSAPYTSSSSGKLKIHFFADATRQVKEADEANNEKTIDITVEEAPPPPETVAETSPSEGGPAPTGALLWVGLLAAAVFAARRRRA